LARLLQIDLKPWIVLYRNVGYFNLMRTNTILIILIVVGIVVGVLLLQGCTKQQPGIEVSSSLTGNGSFQGIPGVDNEIIVNFIIEPSGEHQVYKESLSQIDWENMQLQSFEVVKEGESYADGSELFEIDNSRMEIKKEVDKASVKVPVKILKEGKGFIKLTISSRGVTYGISSWIETLGYIPPEEPPLPEYCQNLTAEEAQAVGCAVEA